MMILVVVLLFIIACAVAPGLMQWLFSVALGLAGIALFIGILGVVGILVFA